MTETLTNSSCFNGHITIELFLINMGLLFPVIQDDLFFRENQNRHKHVQIKTTLVFTSFFVSFLTGGYEGLFTTAYIMRYLER